MNKTFSKTGLEIHLNTSIDHQGLANELVSTGIEVEIKKVILEISCEQLSENKTTFRRLCA
jgi:hypothetical protein